MRSLSLNTVGAPEILIDQLGFKHVKKTLPSWRKIYVNRKGIEVDPLFSLETAFDIHAIIPAPISDC